MRYAKSNILRCFDLSLIVTLSLLVLSYCTRDFLVSRACAEEEDSSQNVSSEPLPDLEFSEFYKMTTLKVPIKIPPAAWT